MHELVYGNIDITELLEEYVALLELGGVPKTSTESKLMLEASACIGRLRQQLQYQIQHADDANKSRVRLLDVVDASRELCEELCKDQKKKCYLCNKNWNCNHFGLFESDCFGFDNNRFNKIVFNK